MPRHTTPEMIGHGGVVSDIRRGFGGRIAEVLWETPPAVGHALGRVTHMIGRTAKRTLDGLRGH